MLSSLTTFKDNTLKTKTEALFDKHGSRSTILFAQVEYLASDYKSGGSRSQD